MVACIAASNQQLQGIGKHSPQAGAMENWISSTALTDCKHDLRDLHNTATALRAKPRVQHTAQFHAQE